LQAEKNESNLFKIFYINSIAPDSENLIMLTTTSQNPDSKSIAQAKNLALEFGFKFAPRETYTLSQLKRKYNDGELITIDRNIPKYIYPDGAELFFHPSIAKIRITSMLKGLTDRLIEVSDIQKGDSVLDCTTGLGTDTIVLSFAVGENGKIVTIENSLILYILAREGLKNYNPRINVIKKAMRRVEAIHADHLDYMKSLPEKSFDMVYFDPMFRIAVKAVALDLIRKLANQEAISPETIKEAKRVARKAVILKEQRSSGEFEKLGFHVPDNSSRSSFEYGVIYTR